jgi:hypothetical protein
LITSLFGNADERSLRNEVRDSDSHGILLIS